MNATSENIKDKICVLLNIKRGMTSSKEQATYGYCLFLNIVLYCIVCMVWFDKLYMWFDKFDHRGEWYA